MESFVGQVLKRFYGLSDQAKDAITRQAPMLEAQGFTVAEAVRYCGCFEEVAGDQLEEDVALARMRRITEAVRRRRTPEDNAMEDDMNLLIELVDKKGFSPWTWAYVRHRYGFTAHGATVREQIEFRRRMLDEDFGSTEALAFKAGWVAMNEWWKGKVESLHALCGMEL